MATGLMWTSSKVGPRGGSRFDQKAVTYTGNSASVANSGKVFDPAEETTVSYGSSLCFDEQIDFGFQHQ